MTFREQVYRIVASVPPGCVVTYGQVAALAGYPRRARHVGKALGDCPADLPWHRVVGAGGAVKVQPAERQLELLRAEGVGLLATRIDLARYGWQPGPLAFAE